MKTVFYTIIGDSHYHGCRTDEFIKSFKMFHPDIDLIVFGQKEIDETFSSNPKLNFYNSKPTFAKKLYNDYDLVVNIDSDHLILNSLDFSINSFSVSLFSGLLENKHTLFCPKTKLDSKNKTMTNRKVIRYRLKILQNIM
jgi:hypothetical protein